MKLKRSTKVCQKKEGWAKIVLPLSLNSYMVKGTTKAMAVLSQPGKARAKFMIRSDASGGISANKSGTRKPSIAYMCKPVSFVLPKNKKAYRIEHGINLEYLVYDALTREEAMKLSCLRPEHIYSCAYGFEIKGRG